MLIKTGGTCSECNATCKSKKALKRKAEALTKPAKLNAPILLTSKERLKLTIQNQRAELKSAKIDMEKLKAEIEKFSVKVSSDLNEDMKSIMSNVLDDSNVSPFMKLFWSEQHKYISSSPTTVRYNPMIIRYCLALASKSSGAYEHIRYNPKTGTGFLILPSQRRLRDYKNYIHPQRGFNKHIIDELKTKVEKF